MTIFLMLFKKYWKHILIVVVFSVVSIYFYNKIYNRGFEAANIVCEKRILEYTEQMNKYKENLNIRIEQIEEASNILAKEALDARKITKKEFKTIITKYIDKPMIVIEEGTCKPSEDFIKAYNEAVDRANK
jgi:soluble cytochrome b562